MDETDRTLPTFYLDQNIIGYVTNGSFPLPKGRVVPVISPEHFTEIARGDALNLLDTLEEIEAQELIVGRDDDNRYTGQAALSPPGAIRARYAEHVANLEGGRAHIEMFQAFVARIWGADNQDSLLEQLGALPETILPPNELATHPEIRVEAQRVSEALIDIVKARLPETTPLVTLRQAFGVDRGRAGDFDPKDAIPRIWERIAPRVPSVTMEQFFWKEPIDRLGYETWPIYMAVTHCHATLNTLGFRPDKGMADETRTANIVSDAIHLANASFCDVLLTADRRLADKAEAIYSFLGVDTHVLRHTAKRV